MALWRRQRPTPTIGGPLVVTFMDQPVLAIRPLTGPRLVPAYGGKARQLVVLLHGLGADGNDLIGLAQEWRKLLPGAAFIAPNAPEPCDMAPSGLQWFSLRTMAPGELAAGVRAVAPTLNAFLDGELKRAGLDERSLALVGFSQGTMLALHVALRRRLPCAAVIGYSGALVNGEGLGQEITSRPPVLLVHGRADELIPVEALFAALAALGAAEVAAEWHISEGVGHGIAADGLELGGTFLAQRLRGPGGA